MALASVGRPDLLDLPAHVGQRALSFRFELIVGRTGMRRGELTPLPLYTIDLTQFKAGDGRVPHDEYLKAHAGSASPRRVDHRRIWRYCFGLGALHSSRHAGLQRSASRHALLVGNTKGV